MRRFLAITAMVSVLAIGVAACGNSGTSSSAPPTPSNSSGTSAAAGQTFSGGSGGAASGQPIVVGQIASLTGNYTPLGTNDKLAAEQAVADVNAKGGLLGRPVKLITEDDKTKPDQAVIDFSDLVSKGAVAIIGSSFSNSSLAVIPKAQAKQITYVSTAASDQQVEPIRPYAFMTPPTAGVVAEQLLRYFKAKGMTKMAVAYATDQAFAVTGWNKMSAAAGKYGITFVDKETFESSATNFSPILTHVRSSGADGLMVWVTGAPAVEITKQFASAGLKMPLVFSHAEASTLYTKPSGSAATGVIVASSLAVVGPELPDSALKTTVMAMATPFQKANGYYPPQFAFDGWDAAQLIFAAITKAGSTDPVKIQQAMNTMTLALPEGTYKFSSTDHSGLSVDDVAVDRVQSDGSLVPTDWSKQQIQSTQK